MNIYPSFTNIRSDLSYRFSTLRIQALRESLWAKINGRNSTLLVFPEQAPQKSPNRRFLGVQDISVEDIVGSLSRQSDFDHKFRPLKKSLCDRWVNAYLAWETATWSPILVHKVGENYYVEDGHYRVSVAGALGMAFIQANVWEYPSQAKEPRTCQPSVCMEGSSARAYAAATK
jgi:hypothetical protein